MKRMLVVVDGSVQASLALDRALEIARTQPASELLLLNIADPPSSWQTHRPVPRSRQDVAERVTGLALAKARSVGVAARARVESGEQAKVAAKVATEERCDHIFMPDHQTKSVASALRSFAGLCVNRDARRVKALTDVPVTVVGREH